MNVRRIGISTLLAVITALAPAAWAQTSSPDPSIYGKWETVIPEKGGGAIGRVLGMQSVHAVLLPSGKVLLASGSSWRNLAPIQFYPKDPNPEAGKGLFNKDEEPFLNQKLKTYYELVNNAGIYDPETNTFYRIPHPVPVPDGVLHFAPNDLFCTGHMHLPNGNVLFAGGTQYYSPFRTGNRSTYIFDWRKELTIKWPDVDWREIPSSDHNPWIFSGFMPRGRWYATLVPLLDGRLSVFGGYVGFDGPDYPEMYMFEMNSRIDFFDPAAFQPGPASVGMEISGRQKNGSQSLFHLDQSRFQGPTGSRKGVPGALRPGQQIRRFQAVSGELPHAGWPHLSDPRRRLGKPAHV